MPVQQYSAPVTRNQRALYVTRHASEPGRTSVTCNTGRRQTYNVRSVSVLPVLMVTAAVGVAFPVPLHQFSSVVRIRKAGLFTACSSAVKYQGTLFPSTCLRVVK